MSEKAVNVDLQEVDILVASSSPHIRDEHTTSGLMRDVIIALMPALLGSIYFFGIDALKTIAISVIAAIVSEAAMNKLFNKESTISDLSAVVTGILLAFNLPATAPWYVPVFGSAFAIIVAKQMFGGLGQNFINPALAGRAALMVSWPMEMTTFTLPGVDAATYSTPMAMLKAGELTNLKDLFLGTNIGGSLGEVSAVLLLIGGIYLIARNVIDWKIPVSYIATVAVTLGIIFMITGQDMAIIANHILGGGLILGAFFMATDYVSVPVSPKGRIIFGIGCGVLTAIIRVFGGYPEGVSYSILLMNVATPIIERFTTPKVFGRAD